MKGCTNGKNEVTKTCTRCGVERSIDRFEKYDNGYGPKVRGVCKDCRNARYRGERAEWSKRYYDKNRDTLLDKSKEYYRENQYSQSISRRAKAYNTTKEHIVEVLSRGCEVCGSDGSCTNKGLHIDHCHETGKVRGCLCHYCNVSLGNLKEDINLIRKLGDYLARHK